ncbi:MAG: HU family DNA-binding protein [Bacteroides sp.]
MLNKIAMNKAELVSAMAEKAGLSKVDSRKALDAFIEVVSDTLAKGEKVSLIGFGTYSVSERKARTGINPATQKPIKIPAKKVAKFKAGLDLANAVK